MLRLVSAANTANNFNQIVERANSRDDPGENAGVQDRLVSIERHSCPLIAAESLLRTRSRHFDLCASSSLLEAFFQRALVSVLADNVRPRYIKCT